MSDHNLDLFPPNVNDIRIDFPQRTSLPVHKKDRREE